MVLQRCSCNGMASMLCTSCSPSRMNRRTEGGRAVLCVRLFIRDYPWRMRMEQRQSYLIYREE